MNTHKIHLTVLVIILLLLTACNEKKTKGAINQNHRLILPVVELRAGKSELITENGNEKRFRVKVSLVNHCPSNVFYFNFEPCWDAAFITDNSHSTLR